MTTLVFLGAGASAPFDIPTMTKMVTKFEDHLKQNNIPESYLYSEIKSTLEKGYNVSQIDIESVFSVIQGIADSVTPQELGSYPYYYIRRFGSERKFSDEEIKDAKKLQTVLEKFIKTECSFLGTDEEKLKIYENSYDPLFRNLFGITMDKNEKGFPFSKGWKAYTTNYDLIFEDYWAELTPIMDYFTFGQSQFAYFDINKNVQDHLQTFVKLHGSLDWLKLVDGSVLKSNPNTFTRIKKKGVAMLYPIQQKDLYLHPWITLFQELKHGLKSCGVWYIVGYAFNDPFVLEIFKELFTSNKRMIIINPHAREFKKKFPENLQEGIMALPIKFGDEYFASDIEDFTRSRRTLEVYVETESKDVDIGFSMPIDIDHLIEHKNLDPHYATTSYGEGQTRLEFHSDNTEKKEILLRVMVKHAERNEDLEIELMTSEEKPVSVTIYNQRRMLDTFTTSKWNFDGSYQRYIHHVILSNDKLILEPMK